MTFKSWAVFLSFFSVISVFYTNCGKGPSTNLFSGNTNCTDTVCTTGDYDGVTLLGDGAPVLKTGFSMAQVGGTCNPGDYPYYRIRYSLRHTDGNGDVWYLLFQDPTTLKYQKYMTDGQCINGRMVVNLNRPAARTTLDPDQVDVNTGAVTGDATNDIFVKENWVGIDSATNGTSSDCTAASRLRTSGKKNAACDLTYEGYLDYWLVMQIQTSNKDPNGAGFSSTDWIDGPVFAQDISVQYPSLDISVGPYSLVSTTSASSWTNIHGAHTLVTPKGGIVKQGATPKYTVSSVTDGAVNMVVAGTLVVASATVQANCLASPTSTSACCPAGVAPTAGTTATYWQFTNSNTVVVCSSDLEQHTTSAGCPTGTGAAPAAGTNPVDLIFTDDYGNSSMIKLDTPCI